MSTVRLPRTKENVERIRELRLTKTNQEIADIFGVRKNTISDIAYNFNMEKRWLIRQSEKRCKTCDKIKKIMRFRKAKSKAGTMLYRHSCMVCERKKGRQNNALYREDICAKARLHYRSDEARRMFVVTKSRAKKKGMEFNLTIEYIRSILGEYCQLSGIKFSSLQEGTQHPFRPSIDRIDNSRGYTMDNVRIILWGLNLAINRYDFDVYLTIAKAVLANIDKKSKVA